MTFKSAHPAVEELLRSARASAAKGRYEDAKQRYVEVLRLDGCHFNALNELALLALATGHRSAALTAYRQAVSCHPGIPEGRVNLGNVYFGDGDLARARAEYDGALACAPDFAPAHQGLARVLSELGEHEAAARHSERGFVGHALVRQPYRGEGTAVYVLLLVSPYYGNVATQLLLDERIFDVTAVYVDYFDMRQPLPPHAVVFNAIGDADLCGASLERAAAVVTGTVAPVINAPHRVRLSGRADVANRLSQLDGLVAPRTRRIRRDELNAAGDLAFPLLVRAPGFHMGRHFVLVERREALALATAEMPGDELLAIEYLDARGRDGMVRKYRVMVIDGVLYPLHLAISQEWKVHYFSSAMATEARYRDEERDFLEDMPGVLGSRAQAALLRAGAILGLDYAGIDFGLRSDGSVLLFEANATMVIVPPPADAMWDYRRPAMERAFAAARELVLRQAGAASMSRRVPSASPL